MYQEVINRLQKEHNRICKEKSKMQEKIDEKLNEINGQYPQCLEESKTLCTLKVKMTRKYNKKIKKLEKQIDFLKKEKEDVKNILTKEEIEAITSAITGDILE
jgi:prefoldin subunit 5